MTLEDLKDFIFWDIKVYGCPSTPEQIEYFIEYMHEKLHQLNFIITDEHQKILDEVYQNNIENNIDLNGGFDFYRYLAENKPNNEIELRQLIDAYEPPTKDKSTVRKQTASNIENKPVEKKTLQPERDYAAKFREMFSSKRTDENKVEEIVDSKLNVEDIDNKTDSVEVNNIEDKELSMPVSDKNKEDLADNHADMKDMIIPSRFDIHKGSFKTQITESFIQHTARLIAETVYNVKQSFDKPEESAKPKREELLDIKPYTAEDFKKDIVGNFDAEELFEATKLLGGILFTSVPGNGKTTICIALAKYIQGNDASPVLINFNPTTSNSDIVGGIRIADKIGWHFVLGTVAQVCEKACNDPEHNYPIILDEINRADTDTAFGELLTAMSKREENVTTNFGKKLKVPKNVYFLMTMNTYDTNVNTLSEALYSRVTIVDVDEIKLSATDIVKESSGKLHDTVDVLIDTLTEINKVLATDKIHKEANCIGNRLLFANYTDYNSARLLLDWTLRNLVKRKVHNLESAEDASKCDKAIDKALEEIKDIWQIG